VGEEDPDTETENEKFFLADEKKHDFIKEPYCGIQPQELDTMPFVQLEDMK
jgi:hypothetical protein